MQAIPPVHSGQPSHLPKGGIERVDWEVHHRWLDRHWTPGEHCSILAPTGRGKSYLIRWGLLPLWREATVLIIDVKGDDETFSGLGQEIYQWPPKHRYGSQPPVPAWYRLVRHGDQDYAAVVHDALESVYRQGDCVVVLDEVRAVTDSDPFLGLKPQVEQLWLYGRSRGVTVIAGTQAPRWVPAAMYEQCKLLYIGKIRNRAARKRLEEIGADLDHASLEPVILGLDKHEFLFVGDSGDMVERVEVD